MGTDGGLSLCGIPHSQEGGVPKAYGFLEGYLGGGIIETTPHEVMYHQQPPVLFGGDCEGGEPPFLEVGGVC